MYLSRTRHVLRTLFHHETENHEFSLFRLEGVLNRLANSADGTRKYKGPFRSEKQPFLSRRKMAKPFWFNTLTEFVFAKCISSDGWPAKRGVSRPIPMELTNCNTQAVKLIVRYLYFE